MSVCGLYRNPLRAESQSLCGGREHYQPGFITIGLVNLHLLTQSGVFPLKMKDLALRCPGCFSELPLGDACDMPAIAGDRPFIGQIDSPVGCKGCQGDAPIHWPVLWWQGDTSRPQPLVGQRGIRWALQQPVVMAVLRQDVVKNDGLQWGHGVLGLVIGLGWSYPQQSVRMHGRMIASSGC